MKAPRRKPNLLIKPSVVLAAAVLAAASLLAPFARAADPPMPKGADGLQPFDPNPAAPGSLTRRFLTYGVDSDGTTVPLKTLRITNNTEQTVYPIMRDPNSNTLQSNKTVGLYDPYDPVNREYRGYIGYEKGGQAYFGLKKGESILVSVPLVFWNGARIGIGTDSQYLAPTGLPNPLRYRTNSQRSITKAETSGDTVRVQTMRESRRASSIPLRTMAAGSRDASRNSLYPSAFGLGRVLSRIHFKHQCDSGWLLFVDQRTFWRSIIYFRLHKLK